MPRLNLDIFSPANLERPEQPKEQAAGRPASTESKPLKSAQPATESPRFVPVGFHAKHLRLLDKAVLNLRGRGHWKANKSALIRLLIDQNADRLESLYLSEQVEKAKGAAPVKQP